MPVDHYENFPVASLLLPQRLRRPIEAIYRFARAADDIADEGDAPDAVRAVEGPHEDLVGHGTARAAIIRSLAPDVELHSVRVLGATLRRSATPPTSTFSRLPLSTLKR